MRARELGRRLISLRYQLALFFVGINSLVLLVWPLFARSPFRGRRPTRLSYVSWILIAMVAAWLLGLWVNVLFRARFPEGAEPLNVVGAAFNIWIIVILLVAFELGRSAAKAGESVCRQLVTKRSMMFLTLLVLIGFVVSLVRFGDDLVFPSLLGLFVTLEGQSILTSVDTVNLFRHDWLFGPLPRVTMLARYPAATAMILVAYYSCYLLQLRKPVAIVRAEILLFGVVLVTLTRSVIAPYILFSFVAILLWKRETRLVASAVLVLGALLVLASIDFTGTWEGVAEARTGSTDTRMTLYYASTRVHDALQLLFGFGGKLGISGRELKLGTHSTVIGSFFKGGIVLFVLTLLFVWICLYTAVRPLKGGNLRYHVFARMRVVACFAAWMLVEDFDADPLSAVMLGLFLGELRGMLGRARTGSPDAEGALYALEGEHAPGG